MANFLENMLSGGKVKRQDDKHLNIAVRPLPVAPRQLFEVFAALGMNATFPGLLRSVEHKQADPHQMVFIALGRWPTLRELADLPDPYLPGPHLTGLIRSREFRAHFVRRTCEVFPERKRLLFVRIPRNGVQSVLGMLEKRHPLLPLDLASQPYNDAVLLMQTLGTILMRMNTSNALAVAHTHMAPFLDTPAGKAAGDDPFAWGTSLPPARVEDLLFPVLRDPQARALGQINALLGAWQSGERPVPAAIMARMDGGTRRQKTGDWRQLGRDILAETLLADPICHALGDGTFEGSMQACSRSPIQLVALGQLNQWSRTALENMSSDSVAESEPILRRQDLRPADVEALEAATRHDQALYDRFARRLKETGLPVAKAREI